MATRGIVRFAKREEGVSFNEHPENVEVQIYNHYDSYPEGLGLDLAKFMCDFRVVNGLGRDEGKVANGMGCLAAQLIADMKKKPGNVYVEKPYKDRAWIDYVYYVWVADGKDIWISIFEDSMRGEGDECIFVGKPEKLLTKYGSQLEESYYKVNTNTNG